LPVPRLVDRSKPITAVIIRDTLSGKEDIHDKSDGVQYAGTQEYSDYAAFFHVMPTRHGRRIFVKAFEKNMKYKGPERILALFSML